MAQIVAELISTRTTLIRRVKNLEDHSSWKDFFDTYSKLIHGIALKEGLSEQEAQDVVQETMISVVKHMPSFKYDRSKGSFKGWLSKLTRWRVIDQLRKRGRFVRWHPPAGDTTLGGGRADPLPMPSCSHFEALWNAEWEKNLLNAAIAKVKRRLDPQKYQIFDLYVNKKWAPERVASTFGVTVPQVYLAKHRATELIREEIRRLEATLG
jgi:RNA polymerase sigma-70 factor (ECF subfamily)